MNRLYLCCSTILLCALGFTMVMVGCSSRKANQELPDQSEGETSPAQLSKQLTQATEAAQIRDLLHQIASHSSWSQNIEELNQLAKQQRDVLQSELGLNSDETEEVESLTFRPMDAHYLEGCFLLRDAVRYLEMATRDPESGGTLDPLQLACFAFSWVNRQILPGVAALPAFGQSPVRLDSWVPSHIVLRRGFGNPRDRALLFLDLLRQMQMDGCLLDSSHPLVGVIHNEDLYLFDPVLGIPVPENAMGKGIATLAMVRQRPELLKPFGISAEDLAKGDIILNCPLSTLSPRMKILDGFLQSNLSENERIALSLDVRKLRQDIGRIAQKNAPDKVIVRCSYSQPERLAPVRVLYSFLPPEEGGRKPLGKDKKEQEFDVRFRQMRLQECQRPFGFEQIDYNLRSKPLRFHDRNVLNPEAYAFLRDRAFELMKLYSLQPREMLVRGQFSPLLKRLKRITDVLEDAPSVFDADFRMDLNEWTRRIQQYAVERKLNSFWKLSDPVFFALLDVNSDLDINADQDAKADPSFQEFEKKDGEGKKAAKKLRHRMLTYVELAGSCRNLMDQQVRFLLAEQLLEKAEAAQARYEHLQARAESLRAGKANDQKVRDAEARADKAFVQAVDQWRNARFLWTGYILKFQLDTTLIKKCFQDFRQNQPSEYVNVETLQRAWTAYCFARLQSIQAMQHAPEKDRQHMKSAQGELNNFDSDLKDLLTDEVFRSCVENLPATAIGRDEFREPVLQSLRQRIALRKQWLEK